MQNKSSNNIISWVCSAVTTACAGVSTSEVSQIILYVIGIISAIISLAYNIYVWYKKAHADGKITVNELKEGKEAIDKGLDELTNKVNNKDKEK